MNTTRYKLFSLILVLAALTTRHLFSQIDTLWVAGLGVLVLWVIQAQEASPSAGWSWVRGLVSGAVLPVPALLLAGVMAGPMLAAKRDLADGRYVQSSRSTSAGGCGSGGCGSGAGGCGSGKGCGSSAAGGGCGSGGCGAARPSVADAAPAPSAASTTVTTASPIPGLRQQLMQPVTTTRVSQAPITTVRTSQLPPGTAQMMLSRTKAGAPTDAPPATGAIQPGSVPIRPQSGAMPAPAPAAPTPTIPPVAAPAAPGTAPLPGVTTPAPSSPAADVAPLPAGSPATSAPVVAPAPPVEQKP